MIVVREVFSSIVQATGFGNLRGRLTGSISVNGKTCRESPVVFVLAFTSTVQWRLLKGLGKSVVCSTQQEERGSHINLRPHDGMLC